MVSIAPMRKSYGDNRYGGLGENDMVCTSPILDQSPKPGLIICHQRAATALGMFADPAWTRLYQDLAEKYVVSISDLGGTLTWGNSNTQTAIGAIRTQLINNYGAVNGKVGLLGISMGGLAALNYAKANPTLVGFVCCIVPAIDINSLKSVNSGAYASEINTAYGGTYTNVTHGPTYSPYIYKDTYPAASVRTAIWYSQQDDIALPQYVEGFKAAQPSVELYEVWDASIPGPPEHETSVPPTIEGKATSPNAFPKPADWCNQRRVDVTF